MNENKVDIALDIMQLKIIDFMKNYKGNDKKEFENQLKKLINERESIYNLDSDIINKALNEYSKEFKKEN